jgi:hypothetical protein
MGLGIVNQRFATGRHRQRDIQRRHVDTYEDAAQLAQDWLQGMGIPQLLCKSQR